MPPRALLFDFDGVLVDTENVHIAAWERTFRLMGWEVTADVCAHAAEMDDRLFLRRVLKDRSVARIDVDGWCRRKQELTRSLLADFPRLYAGVPALIEALRGKVRLGVVTGTWSENVEVVLNSAGLADAFECVIGKEDVRAPKPDPTGYLLALKRLRLPPDRVLALEDSPSGLEAARAAGLRVVAVGHRRPPGEWASGAPFIPDLTDTAAVLELAGLRT